jgi:hypothetical protein
VNLLEKSITKMVPSAHHVGINGPPAEFGNLVERDLACLFSALEVRKEEGEPLAGLLYLIDWRGSGEEDHSGRSLGVRDPSAYRK